MRIDVFTLFPEWFEWFGEQRHVRNAVELGSELRLFNYRDTTPLSGGQVDDSPYGGGAGMVMRVDVVDAALQRRLRRRATAPRRVIAAGALGPAARRRARRRARGRAAPGAALRALRGRRRAGPRAPRRRRDLDRALRARRRRARRDGRRRHRPAQAPRGARPRRERARGVVLGGARRRARVPALHAAGELPGLGGARGPALGRPRAGPRVAAGAQPRARSTAASALLSSELSTI